MIRTVRFSLVPAGLVLWAATCSAQSGFSGSGTTTLSVTVAPEAAIRIDTATTNLTAPAGTPFGDFTGTTGFTYKIRTSKSTGGGSITLQVTSDFTPNGGPSVANAPSSGDTLTYTCNVSAPGAGCSAAQTASTTTATTVASFGANARSSKVGNSGSVSWSLVNDPQYETDTYNATVTFTISAT